MGRKVVIYRGNVNFFLRQYIPVKTHNFPSIRMRVLQCYLTLLVVPSKAHAWINASLIWLKNVFRSRSNNVRTLSRCRHFSRVPLLVRPLCHCAFFIWLQCSPNSWHTKYICRLSLNVANSDDLLRLCTRFKRVWGHRWPQNWCNYG